MKKSELKNIIKECVKEVIFEEGVLSGIITEVAQGLQGASIVQESPQHSRRKIHSNHLGETKKQVLAAIGNSGYDEIKKKFKNPELFEGTSPIPSEDGRGPLSGISSTDAGIDISNIPGSRHWASIATPNRK